MVLPVAEFSGYDGGGKVDPLSRVLPERRERRGG
jgi:hypothetical protein